MRQAFIETLHALALKDKRIFLLNGDLGFSVLEEFTKAYPTRSLNMGVAEANMVGVAAGLAMEGATVFVYSIIPFVTMRVFEQVRNDIALQNTNVKIVGVGSGFTYGQLGPTHHATEDIALMRTLPQMIVVCPGDPIEAALATKALARMKGPAYLRIGKRGEPEVHTKRPPFEIGKGIVVREGSAITLIATGNMLRTAVDVAEAFAENHIDARVISMHTVKPLDTAIIEKAARETKAIFTLEEHSIIGGLGSAVAEVLAEGEYAPIFKRFGVNDAFTYLAGSQEYIRHQHGLTVPQITKSILQIMKNA